ncbi:MAG: hypothetical protein EBX95_08000 [Acidimicrobiia bacterium]|nr:hypothetical protein [Acidimicrobiia bacterium]
MTESKVGHDVLRAASILQHGGIVAVPTETVYGLGALARDQNARQSDVGPARGRRPRGPSRLRTRWWSVPRGLGVDDRGLHRRSSPSASAGRSDL